jgi:hypothetical protein
VKRRWCRGDASSIDSGRELAHGGLRSALLATYGNRLEVEMEMEVEGWEMEEVKSRW